MSEVLRAGMAVADAALAVEEAEKARRGAVALSDEIPVRYSMAVLDAEERLRGAVAEYREALTLREGFAPRPKA